MDQVAGVFQGFETELYELLGKDSGLQESLDRVDEAEAVALGRQAARAALAPLIWGAAVGERWDVRRTCEFLKISRQALYKRVRNGSALGVPGRGTTLFPVWQVDPDRQIIRPVTSSVVREFRDADPTLDPLVIATWATSKNKHLGEMTPAEWITEQKGDDEVVDAARYAAQPLGGWCLSRSHAHIAL